jgi:maltokinase
MISPPEQPGPLPLDRVAAWMARQRWYANKGATPPLEELGRVALDTAEPGIAVVIHLLLDRTAGSSALYQVPLSYRRDGRLASTPDAAVLGDWDGWTVVDAPTDPAYTASLMSMLRTAGEGRGDGMTVRAVRSAADTGWVADALVSRVLTTEQSNTSIIFESAARSGDPVIAKIFRTLHDGANPDVELSAVLADAGSNAVPRAVGHIVADWPDSGRPDGRARGHLAVAQEFLTGAVEGWEVALAAVREGSEFATEARALGIATAGIHGTLASLLPARPMTDDDIASTARRMRARLAAAVAAVPALAAHADALDGVIERSREAVWPDLQRIHGDLHLGQVLQVPERGWVFVDFEGEPMRSMRERTRRDSPLRDVAGMLRSFDYAAGSVAMGTGLAHATDWVDDARAAFTEGYSAASGRDLTADRALVDAFEIDKALYEIVYEVRNRPAWLPIPVAAIERLAARARV